MGGPVPPTPSGELAVDVAPAVLVPNSSVGALSVKQLQRLQTLSLPIPEHLLPTEVQGRFEPRPLVGDSAGALDPRLAETFQYSAVTPAALRTSLTAGWGVEGFSTVPDPAGPTLRRLPKEAGFEITGTVFAERHLVADRVRTRRRDRPRYAGVVGGAVATVLLGYVSLTHLSSALGLLIIPAGLAFAILLISYASFDNAAYWSEMVVARYEGRVPRPPKGTSPTSVPTAFDVQLWVVRALSHDWGTRGASGRNLVAGLRDDALGPARTALRKAITGREDAEAALSLSTSSAEVVTVGWKSHDALGQ